MDEYIETTKKSNESLGEDALKIESTTTKLMDKDVPAIVADLTMGGVTQYTTQAFVEVYKGGVNIIYNKRHTLIKKVCLFD